MLLQTQNVTRRFGGEELFSGVTLEIKERARIGLVGRNGAGKSTLLKILADIEPPDEGRVMRKKNLTTGFLDQHGGLESSRTIFEEMVEIFRPVLNIEKQLRQLELEMADADQSDQTAFQEILNEYNKLQEEFERRNGYGYRSEIKMVLHGFKFFEEDYDQPISYLSGGQKTRLSLAKLLLQKKELLILDEPTNHLDIETLSWLESYLLGYDGSLVIVSHDRYFLDKVVDHIFAYEGNGSIRQYNGGYTDYYTIHKEEEKKEKQEKVSTQNTRASRTTLPPKLKFTFKEQKEFESIDEDIAALEEKIEQAEKDMKKASADFVRLQELMDEKTRLEEALAEKMERWVYLNDLNDRIQAQGK